MAIASPDSIIAKYIVQVNLVHREGSINKLGSFNIWLKGGEFGRADHLMKFCSAQGCTGIIKDKFELTEWEIDQFKDPDDVDNPEAWPDALKQKYAKWMVSPTICDKCGTLCGRYDLPDSYGFNLPINKVADRAAQFFRELGSDCDLFLVRTKEHNIIQKAREELQGPTQNFSKFKNKMDSARDRENVFYPLKSIIKDTAAGGDLGSRLAALIGA